jgi:hypothetical protein
MKTKVDLIEKKKEQEAHTDKIKSIIKNMDWSKIIKKLELSSPTDQ